MKKKKYDLKKKLKHNDILKMKSYYNYFYNLNRKWKVIETLWYFENEKLLRSYIRRRKWNVLIFEKVNDPS